MRKTAALIFAVAIWSCNTVKNSSAAQNVALTESCPKEAECSIQIHSNKQMTVGVNNNSLGYTLSDHSQSSVIIYKFNKIVKGNMQDAGYREELVFEIPNASEAIQFSGADLQKTKLLFGRFCYCKGQTGYYKISDGNLSIDKNRKGTLGFKIAEVPQKTTHISFLLQ